MSVDTASPAEVIGTAKLARMVFEGVPVQPLFERLKARVEAAPNDAGALVDLATLLLLSGQQDAGLNLQAQALAMQRAYIRRARTPADLTLLAIVAAGDLMANTPLDFLMEEAAIDLIILYAEPDGGLPTPPAHDIAFLAIGESEANRAALSGVGPTLARWPKPVLNGDPACIQRLSRDSVSALMADAPGVRAPTSRRLTRAALEGLAAGACPPSRFPLLVRPIASHAGAGLARLDDASAIAPYLAERTEALFYLCPFVDYASADGLYRKQRIALIQGRPFVCHLAISEHWMVHYLNAGMAEHPARRAEEAAFMTEFDQGFAARHTGAFAALHERLGLDYMGIDCAELDDGRLLLFEADTAMIVHAMDPPDRFAYKAEPMRKLFAAFEAMLRASV
jgi:hypothetical protein